MKKRKDSSSQFVKLPMHHPAAGSVSLPSANVPKIHADGLNNFHDWKSRRVSRRSSESHSLMNDCVDERFKQIQERQLELQQSITKPLPVYLTLAEKNIAYNSYCSNLQRCDSITNAEPISSKEVTVEKDCR